MIDGITIVIILAMAALITWAYLRHLKQKDPLKRLEERQERLYEKQEEERIKSDPRLCDVHGEPWWPNRNQSGKRYCGYYPKLIHGAYVRCEQTKVKA